jgi:hypothetical protein
MDQMRHTDKEQEARRGLPNELKPVFDEFVADYKYAATLRHGKPYVSYIVLADMVRAGWRRMADSQATNSPDSSTGSTQQ